MDKLDHFLKLASVARLALDVVVAVVVIPLPSFDDFGRTGFAGYRLVGRKLDTWGQSHKTFFVRNLRIYVLSYSV
jgi:hypothetical protein